MMCVGTDCCVTPVLTPQEAAAQSHSSIPAPHPNLSRTPALSPSLGETTFLEPGAHSREVLAELGYSDSQITTILAPQLRVAKL